MSEMLENSRNLSKKFSKMHSMMERKFYAYVAVAVKKCSSRKNHVTSKKENILTKDNKN